MSRLTGQRHAVCDRRQYGAAVDPSVQTRGGNGGQVVNLEHGRGVSKRSYRVDGAEMIVDKDSRDALMQRV